MDSKAFKISHVYLSQMSDWEILNAYIYAAKVLRRETLAESEEFKTISFFFFEEDENSTIRAFEKIKKLYFDEYLKRHCN
jgi:hypothetical protein